MMDARHGLAALCLVATACASTEAPRAAPSLPPPIAVIPRWAEPAAPRTSGDDTLSARTVLTHPIQETVHIVPPPERDAVDVLLASRRGHRRLRSLALRDAPVTEALRMFAELGGFNLVMADGVGDRRVTLSLRDVSLAAAFRAVLSAAHLEGEVLGGEVLEVRHARAM